MIQEILILLRFMTMRSISYFRIYVPIYRSTFAIRRWWREIRSDCGHHWCAWDTGCSYTRYIKEDRTIHFIGTHCKNLLQGHLSQFWWVFNYFSEVSSFDCSPTLPRVKTTITTTEDEKLFEGSFFMTNREINTSYFYWPYLLTNQKAIRYISYEFSSCIYLRSFDL